MASPANTDRTAVDVSMFLIRLVVGVIFIAHGSQKLFGAFDGPGFEKAVKGLGGFPLGHLVVVGEFFGGLGLVLGVLSRFSAAALIVIMVGAIVRVHWANGFFLDKKGFEYNLALIGLLLPILIAGPGRYTLMRALPFLVRKDGGPIAGLE